MLSAARAIPADQDGGAGTDASESLIVALDVPDLRQAWAIVDELGGEVSHYKVGPHLFVDGLVNFIERLIQERKKKIFLDFKSFDIGETVRGMSAQAARLNVDFMTIGRTASTIVAAKEARDGKPRPKILVVTLLTDHSEADMQSEFNTKETVEQFVSRRAQEAERAGADGVVCSPREVHAIRKVIPRRDFLVVTPGVRPAGSASDDQKRVATPSDAILAGANYLVVGRPIIKAPDRLRAARDILGEMQDALDAMRPPAQLRAIG